MTEYVLKEIFMKKKIIMKMNNKSKIPDMSGIFATLSRKLKNNHAFELKNNVVFNKKYDAKV